MSDEEIIARIKAIIEAPAPIDPLQSYLDDGARLTAIGMLVGAA